MYMCICALRVLTFFKVSWDVHLNDIPKGNEGCMQDLLRTLLIEATCACVGVCGCVGKT